MLPARALHDPALALAPHDEQWVYQRLYDVYRGGEIRAAVGADLVGTLATAVACLGDRPRELIERALPGLQRRGLLVPVPRAVELDAPAPSEPAAYTLKHAPRPRAKALHARPTNGAPVRSAVDEITVEGVVLPGGREANPHVVRAFRTKVSRHMTRHPTDPRRADATTWATFVVDLWAEHQRTFQFRRASDPSPEAAVTSEATPPTVAAVTPPPGLSHKGDHSAVTSISEGDGGEKEIGSSLSLSAPGNSGETTSQTPPARATPPTPAVTSAVTRADVTGDVTEPTGAPRHLTHRELRAALRATKGRVGEAGHADRQELLRLLNDEGVTHAELQAFARLALARKLFTQGTHDRVSLGYLLRAVDGQKAAMLYRWIDDVRAELAKQPELGLAANDPRTGASRAAPSTPKATTGPPAPARPGPVPAARDELIQPGQLVAGIAFKKTRDAL